MAIRLSSVKYEVLTISSYVNTNSSNVYTLNLSMNTLSSNVATLSSNVYAITTTQNNYCNLALSTASTLSGSDLTVDFNRSSDPNSWYASATKRVTPTVAGWYNVYYQVKFNQATAGTGYQWNIQVLRNNVTAAVAQSPMVNDVGQTLTTQAVLYFNGSSDYITAQVYASNTTTLATDPGWSRLELFRLA